MKVGIMFTAGILTISTKGSQGEREDRSGEVIREMVSAVNSRVAEYAIVTDNKEIISRKLVEWADRGDIDVILTTGGTGLSETDVTPEATLAVMDKPVPGIPEIIRTETYKKTPMAMLSRAVAGVRKKCLIINMPGSPKAVSECLEIVMPAIQHAVDIIKGVVTEHGAQQGGENQPHAH
jgi:molybdopterin adenylyltransferase